MAEEEEEERVFGESASVERWAKDKQGDSESSGARADLARRREVLVC